MVLHVETLAQCRRAARNLHGTAQYGHTQLTVRKCHAYWASSGERSSTRADRVEWIKLATFNVNGIRQRLAHLLLWLEREAPDVVCLQELKALDRGFPMPELRRAGYGAVWHGQRSWNGVAILAKGTDPVEVRRGLPGNSADDQSRYIEARVHGIVVGCL